MSAILVNDENEGDNNRAADIEEEPNLPVGVAIEGLRKIFQVMFNVLIRPTYHSKMKSFFCFSHHHHHHHIFIYPRIYRVA